ncbi:GSCOCG00012544001-RA-CDS [Cotesia congregata]|nr:GSCOCG00012544001-RA-CDS [Cotesia congregata]
MFKDLKNCFDHLSTEHLRSEFFASSGTLIQPTSYVIDRVYVTTKNKQGYTGKYVNICGQYIPLSLSFKSFFETSDTLDLTLNYMSSIPKDSAVMENFIQGKLWAMKRSKYSEQDIVIPYFLSGDDVEVNNPLSSHSGKVMAMYASFPCLPPECRSQLKNMLLVLLYESWVRNTNNKMISTNNIYRPLVNGIKFLEEKGIQINTCTGTKTVYFVLGLILGDNLGLHGLLGFTESFVVTYYCRFCKLSKNECKNTFVTLPELKRTPKNYEEDIKLNNISQTGIKEECVFHKIRSFHCTQNFSVDEMHDIRESLAHDDIIAILRALTFEKSEFYSFPLSELNNRLLMFDYGPIDCSNRPTPIREEDIKSETKLKITAAELTTLAKYLGILIKDLVDQSNPYWNLYILLREILDFTLAKKVTKTQIIGFKFVVIRHHILYKELTGKHLKPKFHFITHYSEICQESDPVSHLSSI